MQLSDLGVHKQQLTLDNGAPLVVFERPGMPISLRVAFFSGSRFDPVGKEGLAHFAEHMVLSGNQKYPTKRAISTFIESLGAGFNGTTSADKMDILLDYADPNDTPAIISLLQQFLTTSLFDSQTLEHERGAIQAELSGKMSDPGVYIYRLWKTVAYQGSLLSRDTIGSEESIAALTRDDLLQYYHTQLATNRAVVVASGGLTASQLAKYCNQQPFIVQTESKRVEPTVEQIERVEPIMVKHYPESKQTHLAFGFKSVPQNHPDFWPLFVLCRILGGSRTSRIYHRLRFELGLVYSTFTRVDDWYGHGRIVAHASCTTQHAQTVLNEITQIFQEAAQGSITNDELEHCKSYITKAQKLRMQTSSAWVGYHIGQILKYPNQDTSVTNDLDRINQVSLDQIQLVAQKYFVSDAWYLAVCGDVSAANIQVNFKSHPSRSKQ